MALYASWRQNLRINFKDFIDNLDLSPVLDYLISERVISLTQRDHINTRTTRGEKIHHLLDIIMDASDEILYVFVTALDNTNQHHLATQITGAAVLMTVSHKEVLMMNRTRLIQNMDNELLLDFLQSKEVINNEEAKRIQEKIGSERNAEVLDVIKRKCDSAFYSFIDALNETGQEHIAGLLMATGSRDIHKEIEKLWEINRVLEEKLKEEEAARIIAREKEEEFNTILQQKDTEISILEQKLKKSEKARNKIQSMCSHCIENTSAPDLLDKPQQVLHVRDVNNQIGDVYRVTSLPDGGCLIINYTHTERQVMRLDKEGHTIPPWFVCEEDSDIRGIIHSHGIVYILQLDGTVTKCSLSDLSKSLQMCKVDVGKLWHGDHVQDDILVLTDSERGEVFTYCLVHQNKQVKVTGLNRPISVVFRTDEPQYCICEHDDHKVSLFDSSWQLIKTMGFSGSSDGQLLNPWYATFTPYNTILVADTSNNRISEFSSDGSFIRHLLTCAQDGIENTVSVSYTHPNIWVAGKNQLKCFKLCNE